MAGGSLPVLPKETDKRFLKSVSTMNPSDKLGKYALSNANGFIIYPENEESVLLDLQDRKGTFKIYFLDKTGLLFEREMNISGGNRMEIKLPQKIFIIWGEKVK
jgi:hypothetical protein